jgi:hypothetical protein
VQARLRWFRVLLVAVLFVLGGGTTTASAATFTYDVFTVARFEIHQIEDGEAAPALPGDARDESAVLSAEARGSSTTTTARSVATEAATVRHYTTTEAAESITKAGKTIPGSSSGRTWLTPDEYLDGATAQSKLALNKTPDGYFEIPMCRVSCPSSPSRVQPYNGQPGGGIEITTNSTIDVTGLPFIPFGPR